MDEPDELLLSRLKEKMIDLAPDFQRRARGLGGGRPTVGHDVDELFGDLCEGRPGRPGPLDFTVYLR